MSTGPSPGIGVFHVKHTHAAPADRSGGSVGRVGAARCAPESAAVGRPALLHRPVRSRSAPSDPAPSGPVPPCPVPHRPGRADRPSTSAPSTRRPQSSPEPSAPGPSAPGRALPGRAPATQGIGGPGTCGPDAVTASLQRHAWSVRMPAAAHRVDASGPAVPDTGSGPRHRPDSTGDAEVRRSHRGHPAATSGGRAHSTAEAHGSASRAPGTRRRGPPSRRATRLAPLGPPTAGRDLAPLAVSVRPVRDRDAAGPAAWADHPGDAASAGHPLTRPSPTRCRRLPRPTSLFHVKHRGRPAADPITCRTETARESRGPQHRTNHATLGRTPRPARRPSPVDGHSVRPLPGLHHEPNHARPPSMPDVSDIRTTDQECSGRCTPRRLPKNGEKGPIGPIRRLSGPTRLLRPTPASPSTQHPSDAPEAVSGRSQKPSSAPHHAATPVARTDRRPPSTGTTAVGEGEWCPVSRAR